MKRLLLSAILAVGGITGAAALNAPSAHASCAPGNDCVEIPVQECNDTLLHGCTPGSVERKPGHICIGTEDENTPGSGPAVCVSYIPATPAAR
ncbi:MAG: hypothetical protein QOI20_2845 [Acidimicrobiaceae bacterium]|jgi:hypothetical protein|nr:hypothetical protein [Acidimicrobiaceae bacterium]